MPGQGKKAFSEKSYWTKRRFARQQLQLFRAAEGDIAGCGDTKMDFSDSTPPTEIHKFENAAMTQSDYESSAAKVDVYHLDDDDDDDDRNQSDTVDAESDVICRDEGIRSQFSTDADSCSESETPAVSAELKSDLMQWAAEHQIKQTAISSLLRILKRFHPDLPLDARTLFKQEHMHLSLWLK